MQATLRITKTRRLERVELEGFDCLMMRHEVAKALDELGGDGRDGLTVAISRSEAKGLEPAPRYDKASEEAR